MRTMMTYEVVNREDIPVLRGKRPSLAVQAFLETRENGRAVKIQLNGRRADHALNTFHVAARRRGLTATHSTRSRSDGEALYVWLEKRPVGVN